MNRLTFTVFGLLIAVLLWLPAGAAPSDLAVWQIDSMQKVFKDDAPAQTAALTIDAARNEVVSAQFVVRAAAPIERLQCRPGKLTAGGSQEIPAPRVRYLGYVPVAGRNVPQPLRPRPCDYPDPLYDELPARVPAKTAQPIWLTITVPSAAAPGLYRGTVEIEATVGGAVQKVVAPLNIQVYAALVSEKRTLKVSNWSWFDTPKVTAFCGVNEVYSEPFWKLIEAVARDMVAHRQNSILTPTTAWVWGQDDPVTAESLIAGRAGAKGELEFDFTRFDRWVNIFRAADSDIYFEGSPLAKTRHKKIEYKSIIWTVEQGKAVRRQVESLSPEFAKYLSVYLPTLQAHLEKQGWLDHYMQHVLDEPNGPRKPTYDHVAKLVKTHAPRIRIIDAVQIPDLVGSIDIWVPTLNRLTHAWDFYKERQSKGEELWFYTMGRALEHGLTEPRLLHWANFATGTTGYLHWGYNWWVMSKEPLEGKWRLAAGDEWIVYPAPGGVRDSIRYEAMLEGLQDYELLKTLSARDPRAAAAICEKLVKITPKSTTKYEFEGSIDALRAARRQLLKTLSDGVR